MNHFSHNTLLNKKILIYKRTHTGDPDMHGIFGCQNCMGKIRDWKYDIVIGIGGKSPWKNHTGIRYKINWVGIGPKNLGSYKKYANQVVFDHFKLYEEAGPDIREKYPNLFDYMYLYRGRKRFVCRSNLPQKVLEEIEKILAPVRNSPPSHVDETLADSEDLNFCLDSHECGRCSDHKTTCSLHKKH